MKITLLISGIFISILIYANVNFPSGIVGLTRLNGEGCLCHNINPDDSVHVWIEGPDSIVAGDSAQYKLYLTGGPAIAGGFNVAVREGALDVSDSSTQLMLYTGDSTWQLTHTMPKDFVNDTVEWDFIYKAPDSLVTDTIYSVANSTNYNGNLTDDKWNFGMNFPVRIINNPVYVADRTIPISFKLEQNYPNPFNPSTTIRFSIGSNGKRQTANVMLKVYDIIGNEVATLINKELAAGEYEVRFKGNGLASGIYLYSLQANGLRIVKKMMLMK